MRSQGIEVLGYHVYRPGSGADIGLIPGWEPSLTIDAGRELGPDGVTVEAGSASVAVGVKTTGPHSGLRGFRLTWRDGAGAQRERVLDWAAVTCAPGACVDHAEDAVAGWLLKELGLVDAAE